MGPPSPHMPQPSSAAAATYVNKWTIDRPLNSKDTAKHKHLHLGLMEAETSRDLDWPIRQGDQRLLFSLIKGSSKK